MKVWAILRPDAVVALDDPLVQKILGRYVKIVHDELPANFQILKRIPFEITKSLNYEELLALHKELMKKFLSLKRRVDKGKIELKNLETPRFSLLDLKIHIANEIMKGCKFCEWKCGVNRLEGELGVCKVGKVALISSEHMHYGEESYITPSHTIFFWSCNFDCVFCQNYMISKRLEEGIPLSLIHI